MRKVLLNIHSYGGLLCAPYLVIFGFSSLHFNHRFAFVMPAPATVNWEAPIQVTAGRDNEETAKAVRDSLGLIGWTIPWKMKKDAAGALEFDIEQPGKSYTVRAVLSERKAQVQERRKSFWQVVNSLHALESVPNSRFVSCWGIYTEVCTWFVVFAGVSGVCLWANSRRERMAGAVTLGAAGAFSLGLILFVVWRG